MAKQRMLTKIFILTLSIAICFSMTGCRRINPDNDTSSQSVQVTSDESSENKTGIELPEEEFEQESKQQGVLSSQKVSADKEVQNSTSQSDNTTHETVSDKETSKDKETPKKENASTSVSTSQEEDASDEEQTSSADVDNVPSQPTNSSDSTSSENEEEQTSKDSPLVPIPEEDDNAVELPIDRW